MDDKAIMRISQIIVKKLFGIYDYTLPKENELKDVDKILMLYGDNGSGKTTILHLLFHLLASEDKAGHKTFVAKTKFLSFSIKFSNGINISAKRESEKLSGTFTMTIDQGTNKLASYQFVADEDNSVNSSEIEDQSSYLDFLKILNSFNISLYFLTDSRVLLISNREIRNSMQRQKVSEDEIINHEIIGNMKRGRRSELNPQDLYEYLLRRSIERSTFWIQNQIFKSSNKGEYDSYTLYNDIINRFSKVPIEKTVNLEDMNNLISRIISIENESYKYSKFGLLPTFNKNDILSSIKSAPGTHLPVLSSIIKPYLESIEAKLTALTNIQKIIESFVETLGSFIQPKSITFSINDGFTIYSRNGEPLIPSFLSSGEKHLLLIFYNTISAFDSKSIFIIDEPEISLNIKWQRKLVNSLLEFIGSNSIQYLFATHSFEILSKHMNSVLQLEEEIHQ